MGLDKDKIRNITLAILVLLSFFLSFNLWTAGRNIGEEQNPSSQSVRSNIATIEHMESEAFRPTMIALHGIDNQNPLIVANTFPLRNLLNNRFSSENLSRIETYEELDKQEYLETMKTDQWMEFIFREELPLGLLSQKFEDFSQENADYFFDRILINIENPNFIYFYHTDTDAFYSASVAENESLNIEPFLNTENLNYKSAETRIFGNNIVYLTQEPVDIPYRSYVIDRLPNSLYTSNFYPDPSLVDTRSSGSTTRYIDLTREVTINQQNHTLVFLRQIEDSGELRPTDRFMRSFEQVNRFENWTGTFSLTDYDREDETISFRREIDGLPVFSTSDNETVSEVGLVESGVTHLKLPLRFINTPITMDGSPDEELLSGVEVINQLSEQLPAERYEKIENLTVGYTWEESEEASQVIYFIPNWYILFDGVWTEFEALLELHGEVAYGL